MKLIPVGGRGNEYLFRPEGKKIIWVSRSKKGFGRKQESLRTENPLEAREKRDELFANWLGERPKYAKKVRQPTNDHWTEWVKTKIRKSKATQDSIKYSGQHLLALAGELFPDQLNETWWENVYIPKKRTENKDRKFFNEWKWFTSFLKYLHREGAIERLPRILNPDPPREEGLYLDDDEIDALYLEANLDFHLQIDLGFKHFMRRSEVLLLPWSEIDFKEGVIDLPAERTKVRKGRSIPLNPDTLRELKRRKPESKSPFVFPSPKTLDKPISRVGNRSAWNLAIQRANLEDEVINSKATFHDLRHSGLTRAFAATNRYAEICVVAGLSLEEAQRTYLHLRPEHTRFVSSLVFIKQEAPTSNDNQ